MALSYVVGLGLGGGRGAADVSMGLCGGGVPNRNWMERLARLPVNGLCRTLAHARDAGSDEDTSPTTLPAEPAPAVCPVTASPSRLAASLSLVVVVAVAASLSLLVRPLAVVTFPVAVGPPRAALGSRGEAPGLARPLLVGALFPSRLETSSSS